MGIWLLPPLLATVNVAATNVGVQILLRDPGLSALGYTPGSGTAGSHVALLSFRGTATPAHAVPSPATHMVPLPRILTVCIIPSSD